MLDSLPNREKMCGFISGMDELKNWERSDLFQFYCDTTPIFGSIDFLKDEIEIEDVRRAVRIGACNLYHMCGHNIIHEKSPEIQKSLYKSACSLYRRFLISRQALIKRKKRSCCRFCASRNVKSLKPRWN